MDSWGPSDPKLANQLIISWVLDPHFTFFAILGFFGEVGDHFFSPFDVVQSFRHKSKLLVKIDEHLRTFGET